MEAAASKMFIINEMWWVNERRVPSKKSGAKGTKKIIKGR